MAIKKQEEWILEGTELFGADINKWQFQCHHCKKTQSVEDAVKLGHLEDEAIDFIYLKCIHCEMYSSGLLRTNIGIQAGDKIAYVFDFHRKA